MIVGPTCLQDADNVRALTQMATYDPRAGSIYGGLRQRGMDRAQQDYLSGNPGATGADWLGYITRERPDLVREPFRLQLLHQLSKGY